MSMSPRLMRPRQNIHPEAAAWAARVVANGGSVGTSLSAVDKFCKAIASAGIRDRFYRLNLVCGGTSGTNVGLNSATVPLYRGPTISNTFGNAVDTNSGSAAVFAAADYNETGTNGGLKPDGSTSTKYLNTGLLASDIPTLGRHMSVWADMTTHAGNRFWMGTDASGCEGGFFWGLGSTSATEAQFRLGNPAAGSITGVSGKIHFLATGNGTVQSYLNGAASTSVTSTAFTSAPSRAVFVGALNRCGSPADAGSTRFAAYSLGLEMNSAQASGFYNALYNFQVAMGRV